MSSNRITFAAFFPYRIRDTDRLALLSEVTVPCSPVEELDAVVRKFKEISFPDPPPAKKKGAKDAARETLATFLKETAAGVLTSAVEALPFGSIV